VLRQTVIAACEKVIVSSDLDVSLITLFDKLTVEVAPGIELPASFVAAKEWALFSKWLPEPGDELKEYVHCFQMMYPDQSPFGNVVRQKLRIEPKRQLQNIMKMVGFPIGRRGMYTVRVWIEQDEKVVLEPIDLKIEVEWKITQSTPPVEGEKQN
jgi:hypothetical protein